MERKQHAQSVSYIESTEMVEVDEGISSESECGCNVEEKETHRKKRHSGKDNGNTDKDVEMRAPQKKCHSSEDSATTGEDNELKTIPRRKRHSGEDGVSIDKDSEMRTPQKKRYSGKDSVTTVEISEVKTRLGKRHSGEHDVNTDKDSELKTHKKHHSDEDGVTIGENIEMKTRKKRHSAEDNVGLDKDTIEIKTPNKRHSDKDDVNTDEECEFKSACQKCVSKELKGTNGGNNIDEDHNSNSEQKITYKKRHSPQIKPQSAKDFHVQPEANAGNRQLSLSKFC